MYAIASVAKDCAVVHGAGGYPMPILYIVRYFLNNGIMPPGAAARMGQLTGNKWTISGIQTQIIAQGRNIRIYVV